MPPATTTDPGTGQTPLVAGQQPTGSGSNTGAAAPVAALAPAKDNHHDLLMVLLILLLFGILYTQNASQRTPRRLGADAAVAAGAAGTAATLPVAYPAGVEARGLGRFAKPRSTTARPLI